MSKSGLISVVLAAAMTVSPIAAMAQGTPGGYQGPLPAGGAMSHPASVAWFETAPAVAAGGGAILAAALILALSGNHHGGTTTTTTTTTSTTH